MGDWGDVLKNVRDGASMLPIVGAYIGNIGPHDEEGTGTSRAIEKYFLSPGAAPLEKAMHGMNWLYDNAVSQPLTTGILMGSQAQEEGFDKFFSTSEWGKAWRAANHISPGQAFTARAHSQAEQLLGHDVGPASARELIGAKPLYATPSAAYLPPGWEDLPEEEQQRLLEEAGMPVVGNRAVEALRRDAAFFTFASGAADFAARWWLDPTVLAGRGIAAVRRRHVVTQRPAEGWSAADIDRMMTSSRMARAQEFLWNNRNQPDLINNLSMFRKSALGPRAGGIISQLRSREEVNLFLRTTLGDVEARALLQERNAAAALRMEQDTSRLSSLEMEFMPRIQSSGNPQMEALLTGQRDVLRTRIAADEDMVARYTAALNHYGELDALNLTRWSGSRALARTSNQRLFRTGPALGTRGVAREGEAGTTAARARGLSFSRIYADDMFGSSATMVRSFAEKHPNGLIAIDDLHPEAIDELRGHIARIPGVGPNIRADLLNRYLQTTSEGQRLELLEEIQSLGVTRVGQKHGLTHDEAMGLYREYRANITHGQEELRRYSGANFGDERQSVDIFTGQGDRLVIHPNMVTKLANSQVLIDLNALDKTLARHSSAISALRTRGIGNSDWLIDGLDWFSHLWKFATLFRLGYIPRVLTDDLLGQTARLGAATMAVRAGYGARNLATNLFQWRRASHYEGAAAVAREGMRYLDDEIRQMQGRVGNQQTRLGHAIAVQVTDVARAETRLRRARQHLESIRATGTPVQIRAAERHVHRLDREVANRIHRELDLRAQAPNEAAALDDLLSQRRVLEGEEQAALRGFRQSSQLYREVDVGGGVRLPPALAGEQGEYYMKLISSDDSLRTLLQRNKQIIHSNLQRAASTKAAAPISYPGTENLYVEAWHKAINHQIMQDEFARMAVQGASIDDMARWLTRTPEGRAYRTRLGITYDTPERIAASVWHEVDEYMPVMSGVREAAIRGEADMAYLTELARTGQRPQYVHSAQLGEALAGSNVASRSMDRVVDWFYKWAASVPADRMSRHPLFNQLYEGHARSLASQELRQGARLTQADADRLAETARRLALKDTRKLVFDIAHRSDAAHMLRFMSPFFAATTEAWQRWARIIADRPQTVGYASMFFNTPISLGVMQDRDGNKIMRDGTVMTTDATGKTVKRFVPKGERMIITRVPKFLAESDFGKALGMNTTGDWLISQDSMNLITQGDPWFNPGTGPVVSIPASMLVKDKPKQAEMLRHLGVLPFGPTPGGVGDTVLQQSLPLYARNFLTAFDTSDERYQRIKLQIMQRAAYEHANFGTRMPTPKEIADQTRNYWLFTAGTAWLQPFATTRQDKYQFFRDQYNALRRKDPLKADEEFLDRFGQSYFIFAQATTENEGGVPATKKAVELSQRYADLIGQNPELAALIVGPEGNGPFSPEAYAYQLSVPLVPGGAEMQRTRLSADEAMAENQRRLGWAKFTQLRNAVTAMLHSAGFESFEDEGAEDYKRMRAAIPILLGRPTLPDGSKNKSYNEQWSKDFFTTDSLHYDRLIPGLTAVANSELAKLTRRNDLRKLGEYLRYRQAVVYELNRRYQERTAEMRARGLKGDAPKALTAKDNADLKSAWLRIVDSLVESDTDFGDLYHRYLSRDMGVDLEEEEAEV